MGYPLAKRLRLAAAGGVRVVVAAAAGEPEPEQLVVRGLLARVAEVVTDTDEKKEEAAGAEPVAPHADTSEAPSASTPRSYFFFCVERFIVGFFASLIPQWQPPEVPPAPAQPLPNPQHLRQD